MKKKHEETFLFKFQTPKNVQILKENNKITIGFMDKKKALNGLGIKIYFPHANSSLLSNKLQIKNI
jgi:hypothetical protein